MDNDAMEAGEVHENRWQPFGEPMTGGAAPRTVRLRLVIGVVVFLLLGGLAYYYKSVVIAATVNGHAISRLAVIRQMEKGSGKKVLDSLIDERLIKQEIAAKKVTVADAEVQDEIKKIEAQVAGQQGNLAQLLQMQGVTQDEFKERITVQKQIEKLLGDKIAVSDAEADKYVADNKLTAPQGQEAQFKDDVKYQLRAQKFSAEAEQWIAGLRANAKINYFVNY